MSRLLVAALALPLALLACSDEDEPPDVDWSGVPQNQRTLIERATDDRDCEQMQTYFDGSDNADVLAYLDWHLQDAGCYE